MEQNKWEFRCAFHIFPLLCLRFTLALVLKLFLHIVNFAEKSEKHTYSMGKCNQWKVQPWLMINNDCTFKHPIFWRNCCMFAPMDFVMGTTLWISLTSDDFVSVAFFSCEHSIHAAVWSGAGSLGGNWSLFVVSEKVFSCSISLTLSGFAWRYRTPYSKWSF